MYDFDKEHPISRSFLYQLSAPLHIANNAVSFFYLMEGRVRVTGNSCQYEMPSGSLLLLKEEDSFLLVPKEASLMLSVQFDYLCFLECFGKDFSLLDCNSAVNPDKDYKKLIAALAELTLFHISNQEENRFLILHQVYSIFHYLKTEFISMPKNTVQSRLEKKLVRLERFIEEHCTENITLSDAAAYMDYTPQYLSNFIKKNRNTTFNTYLNHARLEKALPRLKYRDHPLHRIASECGFSSCDIFFKAFMEQYGTTPEKYRSDFKARFRNTIPAQTQILEPSVIRNCVINHIRFVDEQPKIISPSITEHDTCSVLRIRRFEKNWDKMINLGNALNFESPVFRSQILRLQSRFHFTYGRLIGIQKLIQVLFDETAPDDKAQWVFQFSRAFELIDFLLGIQIRPHFDFGGKPFDIYLNQTDILSETQESYLEHMELTLEKFLCACINRYGFDEVSNWNFEYWMRHNSSHTRVESAEEFFEHFSFFYRTIKKWLPDANVGAPGYNMTISPDYLAEALKMLQSKNICPDFVSALFYPYDHIFKETESQTIQLTEDPDLLYKKIDAVYDILKQIYTEIPPLYIAEYSTFVSPLNYINDSIYQGAFILRQALGNLGHVPVLSYYVATDYSMHYPDSAELLFGGNGLLTKDGICKPGYHAYDFLMHLGTYMIGKGEHYIVTSDGPCGDIQILVYHYVHFFEEYARHPQDYISMKNPDSVFLDVPFLQIEIELTDLMPGRYKISRYSLGKDSGSILDKWIKFDYARHMRPDEIEHLKNVSVPGLMITKEEVQGSIQISQKLEKNEAVLILLHHMF